MEKRLLPEPTARRWFQVGGLGSQTFSFPRPQQELEISPQKLHQTFSQDLQRITNEQPQEQTRAQENKRKRKNRPVTVDAPAPRAKKSEDEQHFQGFVVEARRESRYLNLTFEEIGFMYREKVCACMFVLCPLSLSV
jgi:hypothetical protein